YIPRREANETRDNNGGAGATAKLKMYIRDDSRQAEFGVCLDGGQSPWIQGGSKTSQFRMMIVFGDWPEEQAAEMGHKLYAYYYFPLEAYGTFRASPAPGPRFIYETVQPDKLVYKTGDTINIMVTGSPKNATIYVDTRNIDVNDPATTTMTNRGDGSWNYSYYIDAVTGTGYDRYIKLTADVPGVLWTENSTYYLNITIDNTPPSPTAELASLPSPTTEASVLLDWSAIPGFDEGCSSMENPSGLGWYRLLKGTASGVYDTILADKIPITTTQFVDSFIENGKTYYYKIETYDAVGNVNTTAQERSTTINLPYTPAQPTDLPPTQKSAGGILIDWSENPGYGPGVTITGYRVYRAYSLDGPYIDVSGALPNTQKTWPYSGPFEEATTYYFKVLTETAGVDLFSSPVYTKIDDTPPAPAELATPLPTYKAEKAEIIVSWAIETLPQYQTGGFPGQDLNGIDHWTIYKKVENGPWYVLGSVPYGPLPEDQRIIDTNVVNGTTYSYSIETFDGAGNSALCEYNKTTKLSVVGPGKAEVYSITPGSEIVKQGQISIPITVLVRNPGATDITLDYVQLYFKMDNFTQIVNVTDDYEGVFKSDGNNLATFSNKTFVFYVNVSSTAHLGSIIVDAQVGYDTTKSSVGALNPSSWTVTPDANLIIKTVSSQAFVIHPGDKDIPVKVTIENPGKSNMILETVQLIFKRDGEDLTNKFLTECLTSLPTSGFNRSSVIISFNVTVSQSITTGGVIVDAYATGSASGVYLEDSDGAATPLNWAIQTLNKPVIADIEADKEVYWTGDTITLTVTCDKPGHTVEAFFGALDGSSTNETGIDNNDNTYTITHILISAAGEGYYPVVVYATNSSGSVNDTIEIRLGQAPTFSNHVQNPSDGNVNFDDPIYVSIDITDNNGPDSVSAYLKYRLRGGIWNNRPMTHVSATKWEVTIPAQTQGGLLEYIINATDMAGNWALYSTSTYVKPPPTTPILIEGSESVHDPNNPDIEYNETPGYGAPLDTPIAYSINITTEFMETPGDFYYVIVSAFDPIRNCYLSINDTVWLEKPNIVDVTLFLNFPSSLVSPGTLIIGNIYLCTDLPSNGGRTISIIPFTHLVE
ncbi:MAG: hypothetical protein ACTSYB_16120, partial [Candidatus Helarchaeota archaeon]